MKIETLFTDREGGVSAPPYDSFNLAYHTGDESDAIRKNRERLQGIVGAKRVIFMEQIHGDKVVKVDDSSCDTTPACDAIITSTPNIALAVMVADCIPLLLQDRRAGAIAAVHAGRNGTFMNIAAKTVKKMVEAFGCKPENIEATLGPSIHPCCYEVSEELAVIAAKSFGERYVNGRYLDLQSLNKEQLKGAGLQERNIEISKICTCCSERYFSYRREGVTGRFAGVIWIKPS